ncbi:type I-F CRISPR-associated endoribonuclease Cas6/Csy4 [Limisalsivibrio acetivorans]|uniref:type I-F CRISPR-associated endoribonuclease Cas6/Csy4 n=1 Tax=Limisalsivibrio acetivorans TaxID=1304888 RepID=UPI0003B5A34E|nr:type I-F CRISPR-associated endoribonuclease Cas6/Csy4 [Limisalsivibrio acetivorans]
MTHYVDIKAVPPSEVTVPVVLNKVFSRFHKALVQEDSPELAVSFPKEGVKDTGSPLGDVIRVHGEEMSLKRFMETGWLGGMRDYVQAGMVKSVPSGAEHVAVRRVQVKSSMERVRRRQMKRHGYTEEEAREKYPDSAEKRTRKPFINVKSGSTEHSFRLFIQQKRVNEPGEGGFNKYGLSKGGTVPLF